MFVDQIRTDINAQFFTNIVVHNVLVERSVFNGRVAESYKRGNEGQLIYKNLRKHFFISILAGCGPEICLI